MVGVDGSDLSGPAIGFALRAAVRRGIGLTALHAWTPRPPADLGGLGDDETAAEAVERRRLDDALARWREWFPAVDIASKLVRGDRRTLSPPSPPARP